MQSRLVPEADGRSGLMKVCNSRIEVTGTASVKGMLAEESRAISCVAAVLSEVQEDRILPRLFWIAHYQVTWYMYSIKQDA